MYAIELTSDVPRQAANLHPKRLKQVYLRIIELQQNPHPPDAQMLDVNIYRVRVGPYQITYEIDDKRKRVRVFLLQETERAE